MIEIAPIAEEHIPGFHACLDEVARERRYLGFVQAPPLEAVREFVRGNIEKDIPQVVALDKGRVVGWCDITPHSLEGFTHCGRLGMGVLAAYRRQGIGQRLLRAAMEWAQQAGLERIELEVFASNKGAIALYEREGFKHEGIQQRGRKLDGKYDDGILMGFLFPG